MHGFLPRESAGAHVLGAEVSAESEGTGASRLVRFIPPRESLLRSEKPLARAFGEIAFPSRQEEGPLEESTTTTTEDGLESKQLCFVFNAAEGLAPGESSLEASDCEALREVAKRVSERSSSCFVFRSSLLFSSLLSLPLSLSGDVEELQAASLRIAVFEFGDRELPTAPSLAPRRGLSRLLQGAWSRRARPPFLA